MVVPTQPAQQAKSPAEKVFTNGDGMSVVIYRNRRQGTNGQMLSRSVYIYTRTYSDPTTGELRKAPLRPDDLGSLMFLLGEAQRWLAYAPTDGEGNEPTTEVEGN